MKKERILMPLVLLCSLFLSGCAKSEYQLSVDQTKIDLLTYRGTLIFTVEDPNRTLDSGDKIFLYDDNNNLLDEYILGFNDDGEFPDEEADDGIFTTFYSELYLSELSPGTRQGFKAMINGMATNTVWVDYFTSSNGEMSDREKMIYVEDLFDDLAMSFRDEDGRIFERQVPAMMEKGEELAEQLQQEGYLESYVVLEDSIVLRIVSGDSSVFVPKMYCEEYADSDAWDEYFDDWVDD